MSSGLRDSVHSLLLSFVSFFLPFIRLWKTDSLSTCPKTFIISANFRYIINLLERAVRES